jgi:hypothetical protein
MPAAGRMAADAQGCWVSTDRSLLRIDVRGAVHRVLAAQLGDVATGAGSVWLPQADTMFRLDERTGGVQTLHTGPLRLGGFQHDVAAGAGALWTLAERDRYRSQVERRDLRTGRLTGRVRVPGIADAVAARPDGLWVATVASSRFDLFRFDARTLRLALVMHVP